MDKEKKTEMENAQHESGESVQSSENVSDEGSANKGGRPKRHFDPEDPFNLTFGLEYECFCEEALAWLHSCPETMHKIMAHKKRDWPANVTNEPARAAFRRRCKNYKLDLGRTGLVYSRRLCDGTCEYFHFHFTFPSCNLEHIQSVKSVHILEHVKCSCSPLFRHLRPSLMALMCGMPLQSALEHVKCSCSR